MLDSWHDPEYQKVLVQARAQFNALFANSPDAIFIGDPHVSGAPRIACNDAYVSLHRIRREDFLGLAGVEARLRTSATTLELLNASTREDLLRLRREMRIIHHTDWEQDGQIATTESTWQLITLAAREMFVVTDHIIPREVTPPVTDGKADPSSLIAMKYFRYLNDGVVIYDPFAEGRPIVDCNQRYARKIGYTRQELIGKTIFNFDEKQDEKKYEGWMNKDLTEYVEHLQNNRVQFIGVQPCKDGSVFSTNIIQYAIQDEGRDLMVSIIQDLTEIERSKSLDYDRNRLLENIAQKAPLEETLKIVTQLVEQQISDVRCAIIRHADQRFKLGSAPRLPHEYSLLLDQRADDLIKGAIGNAIARHEPIIIEDAHVESQWRDEPFLTLNPHDAACWIFPVFGGDNLLALLAIYSQHPRRPDGGEANIVNIAVRLSGIAIEQHILNERLAHQAEHDILTGLPNRLLFHDRLHQSLVQAQRKGSPLAVFFLDLDGFKRVNDTMGHAAGDELLRQVSQRLQSCVRVSDTVARIGGDEFTFILRDLQHPHDTTELANKIIDALEAPFKVQQSEVFVSASIGIAFCAYGDDDAETLIHNADAAMYRAKQSGKNRVEIYEKRFTQVMNERQELKSQLRQALERNEFEMYYQPQIDLKSGLTVGLEALIRWRHPRLETMLPLSFIPAAEESGIILKIGQWALRTACNQLQTWKAEWRNRIQQETGKDSSTRFFGEHLQNLRVSVNISALQFGRTEFYSSVVRALRESGIDAASLELELTESALMQNIEESARQMETLRSLGVRIAVDDFGTGYSSLSYLQRLSIDVLKIDRSFIHGIHHKDVSQSLVQAIVTLGHNLNLQVLAEGTEVPSEVEALRKLNCDMIQGFIVTPPLSADAVTAFLFSHDADTNEARAFIENFSV